MTCGRLIHAEVHIDSRVDFEVTLKAYIDRNNNRARGNEEVLCYSRRNASAEHYSAASVIVVGFLIVA